MRLHRIVILRRRLVLRGDVMTLSWADDSHMSDWDMGAVSEAYWRRMKFSEGKPTTLRYRVSGLPGDSMQLAEGLLTQLEKKQAVAV